MSIRGPRSTVIDCSLFPSMTKQSMKDEVDINRVVARYKKTGMFTHVNERTPIYQDVSDVVGYREALDRVREVEVFFTGLPAHVRAEFENDPSKFLDFMADPANAETADEMGLKPKIEEPLDEIPGPGVQARGVDGRTESPAVAAKRRAGEE